MPSSHDFSLAVLAGQRAPGPLDQLDQLLADKLDAASDATHEADQWVVIARQALARACGPGVVMPTETGGEEYDPKLHARHKAAAAAAAQLAEAAEQSRKAAKELRDLALVVERAAALLATQLEIPHYLPSLHDE